MAFDDNGFMQKLRLNNVFPAEGRGNPNPLIGMPDFTYPPQQQQQQAVRPQMQQNSSGAPAGPARPIVEDKRIQPQNTAWIPGAADINAGRMVMGETPREEHQRAMELQSVKSSPTIQKNSIAAFKAQNPNMKFITMKGGNVVAFDPLTGEAHDTGISSGTMTEEDKQLLVGGQAADRNDASIAGREEVAGMNIAGRKDVAGMNNTAAGERNAASIAGRENVAGMNNATRTALDGGMQPNQKRTDENNKARQLAQDPYLAKFITILPNGNFAINGNPPLDVLSRIQQSIYGKPENAFAKDVELPADNPVSSNSGVGGIQKSVTPTSKTPTANMSLPSQSRFKVSVE
jgi:hypothetical protein